MTSAEALELAHQVIEDNPEKAGPLVKLLYAFRESRGDPLGEVMMNEVIGTLYTKTEHCESSIKKFISLAA